MLSTTKRSGTRTQEAGFAQAVNIVLLAVFAAIIPMLITIVSLYDYEDNNAAVETNDSNATTASESNENIGWQGGEWTEDDGDIAGIPSDSLPLLLDRGELSYTGFFEVSPTYGALTNNTMIDIMGDQDGDLGPAIRDAMEEDLIGLNIAFVDSTTGAVYADYTASFAPELTATYDNRTYYLIDRGWIPQEEIVPLIEHFHPDQGSELTLEYRIIEMETGTQISDVAYSYLDEFRYENSQDASLVWRPTPNVAPIA